jgi:uncharacterized protein YcfL
MRIATLLVAAAVAAGLAGCKSSGPRPPSESCPGFEQAGSTQRLVREKVQFLGSPDVQVREMRCVVHDGLLRVDVDIENDRSRNQQVEYRFLWFEPNGMSIGPEEVWKPLVLYPNERRIIRTAAPSVRALDFQLVVKR